MAACGSNPALRRFSSALPEKVEQAVLKALARDPIDRYQTVEEMLKALQKVSRDSE